LSPPGELLWVGRSSYCRVLALSHRSFTSVNNNLDPNNFDPSQSFVPPVTLSWGAELGATQSPPSLLECASMACALYNAIYGRA